MRLRPLRGIGGASFNPARLPQAKKDVQGYLSKRYGFDSGGKGGFGAGVKRSDDAKKTDSAARDKRISDFATAKKISPYAPLYSVAVGLALGGD